MLTWQQWINKSQASMTAARNSNVIASETKQSAAGDLAAAVSRSYFAAFQSVTGALIKQGNQPNPATGNWGHTGTQNQFIVLIRKIRSKQRRLRQARQNFRNLYLARPYADYGDDSIFTTNTVEQLVQILLAILRRCTPKKCIFFHNMEVKSDMAQQFIVEIAQSGTVVLPEELRKYIPEGAKFSVSLRGDTISLKKVEGPVIPREPEVVARFRALREYFSKWAKEQGITEHDIKETIKKVRAEKHAKSNSQ